MAGGISIGTAIGIMGGSPLMKVRQVIGEYLPLTKSLDSGPDLGGLMQKVIAGGGLQAILPNPMQAVTGQLQGAIGQAAGALANVPGASGLISALNGPSGLASAATGLMTAGADLLSGPGVLGMIAHGTMAEMAGDALPPALGIDAVLGPLTAGAAIADMATSIPALVSDVVAGRLNVAAATLEVQVYAIALEQITQGSADALSGLAGMSADIAAVSTVAAAFVSAPPAIAAVLESSMGPDTAALMRASVARHLDVD